MGRINIPGHSKMLDHEKPYYWIQVLPDRIKYDLASTLPVNMVKNLIIGAAGKKSSSFGYNDKIEFFLLVLGKREAFYPSLLGAWTRYSDLASQSQNLKVDQPVKDSLLEFQRFACVGSSYKKLPKAAQKAAFWEQAAEVPPWLITQAEHAALDNQPGID
jgi:hypothetical protein